MLSDHQQPIAYQLPVGDQIVPLNALLNKPVRLFYTGAINCSHCGRKSNKSFSQGYCYPCFRKLPQCDTCIMSPERCHYELGTCRDASWGEEFCMTDHIVYLANSSGIKVGITRENQVPTRWIDQGAVQALPIFRVATRQQSGLVETVLKEQVSDKTNWRKMLKGEVEPISLVERRDEILAHAKPQLDELKKRFGLHAIQEIEDVEDYEFEFPVLEFPTKVTTHNFDKNPTVEGTLKGIKGQYLILDTGVINIRKFTAYHIEFYA